jgi:hypothetical protein
LKLVSIIKNIFRQLVMQRVAAHPLNRYEAGGKGSAKFQMFSTIFHDPSGWLRHTARYRLQTVIG